MSEPRDVIGAVLPKSWSQTKRDDVADQIVNALFDAGLLLVDDVTTIEVRGARVPVETVEAYGLTIRVDANGNAAEITSPWGLEILA
jgi:hypothetical protein